MTATRANIHQTVKNMINEIGQLRQLVAIDSMPPKLQTVRQLLRELDADLESQRSITSYYRDRANGQHAAKAPTSR